MVIAVKNTVPSTCAILKRKAEGLPMSALPKNRTANAENDDFRTNLLTRLFDPIVLYVASGCKYCQQMTTSMI
jgi:hypothetical protein